MICNCTSFEELRISWAILKNDKIMISSKFGHTLNIAYISIFSSYFDYLKVFFLPSLLSLLTLKSLSSQEISKFHCSRCFPNPRELLVELPRILVMSLKPFSFYVQNRYTMHEKREIYPTLSFSNQKVTQKILIIEINKKNEIECKTQIFILFCLISCANSAILRLNKSD